MRVAFHAPLKPPGHPVPSGDRLIARLFVAALRMGGHEVVLPSRLRTREGQGNDARQARIRRVARRVASRLETRLSTPDRRPDLWFTYHLYHKAPDLLGPRLARHLGIPYVVAEASVAPKQRLGPWARGYCQAADAIRMADAVIALNSTDVPCLAAHLGGDRRIIRMAPFLDLEPFAALPGRAPLRHQIALEHELDANVPWLFCAAMMRPGNKVESFRVLARAMRDLGEHRFVLLIAGDGAARAEVESMFVGCSHRVAFLGLLEAAAVRAFARACDLFVWPAVDEPLGMAMLEAQAAGLAVIAGAARGVVDVVADGETGVLVPPGDAGAFAGAVARLLDDPGLRARLAREAGERTRRAHGLDAAARQLTALLDGVVRQPRR